MKLIFKLLVSCLAIALFMLLMSCGARKANKQSSKEETKSEVIDNSVVEKQTDTNVKTTTTVKVDDKNETVTEETIYEPEDNTKEAFIIEKDGTKVVLNNTKKVYKKTTQKNNTQSELVNNIDELKKETVKEQKAFKQVNASKKENSSKETAKTNVPWYFYLVFIIPFLIVYVMYRIYKKLPLFPKL